MARIVVLGAGVVGLGAAMMLAEDGHRVTVLERDPEPPPGPDQAWESWARRGVNQFRLPHFLLARFRSVADTELPGLVDDLAAAGALRANPIVRMAADVTGGPQPGDDRFELVTARRPVVEAVVAAGPPPPTVSPCAGAARWSPCRPVRGRPARGRPSRSAA